MTCQRCKGLLSVVKAHPATGKFEVEDCSCTSVNKTYQCNDTGAIIEVTEITAGLMSVIEHYELKNYRRIINYSLFKTHLEEGIITPLQEESH